MIPLRLLLSVFAGLGAALLAYALVYTHGNPRPTAGDPTLAFQLLPLELLIGLAAGLLFFRVFGRRQGEAPREDVAERMVLRLAMRRGGRFTLDDLVNASPLTEAQARDAVRQLLERGRLREEPGGYSLSR